ncbi:MAG: hypothetical protein RIA09_16005 [Hoeflea sp.]|jgi:hypothetical protein|uniref:hypothetical protein n=1 Tax=Hoeflea sp. TaxID=1940281 RepID=UPI0032EE4CE9
MAKLKWTVEFEIDATWVADGFVMTDERALEMLASDLGWASESELGAKVIKHPSLLKIAKLQGYPSVKKMLEDDPQLAEALHMSPKAEEA